MAFLASWFWNAMEWLGVYMPKDAKILVLGLDNAGKTTMLRFLSTGQVGSHLPTGLPYSEEVLLCNGVRVKAFDMGGQRVARRVWKGYFPGVDGIVYMVDSSDTERLAESRKELAGLLDNESLADVPIAVFGNKIDHRSAVSESELRVAMGVLHTTGKDTPTEKGVRPVEVFMCSIVAKLGVKEGMDWFSKALKARRKA